MTAVVGGSSANANLRVAMLAPISWRVPPRHYGPWEQFVSLLTEGLVARGVEFLSPPEKQPWGEFAKFKDPDGNQFVLSSG